MRAKNLVTLIITLISFTTQVAWAKPHQSRISSFAQRITQLGVTKKSISARGFLIRNSAITPHYIQNAIRQLLPPGKDFALPKIKMQQLKIGGVEQLKIIMSEGKDSLSLTFTDSENAPVAINGVLGGKSINLKVSEVELLASYEWLPKLIGKNYQVPKRVKFLEYDQWRAMPENDRTRYLKRIQEVLIQMEKLQFQQESSKSAAARPLKIEILQQLLLESANAEAGLRKRSCPADHTPCVNSLHMTWYSGCVCGGIDPKIEIGKSGTGRKTKNCYNPFGQPVDDIKIEAEANGSFGQYPSQTCAKKWDFSKITKENYNEFVHNAERYSNWVDKQCAYVASKNQTVDQMATCQIIKNELNFLGKDCNSLIKLKGADGQNSRFPNLTCTETLPDDAVTKAKELVEDRGVAGGDQGADGGGKGNGDNPSQVEARNVADVNIAKVGAKDRSTDSNPFKGNGVIYEGYTKKDDQKSTGGQDGGSSSKEQSKGSGPNPNNIAEQAQLGGHANVFAGLSGTKLEDKVKAQDAQPSATSQTSSSGGDIANSGSVKDKVIEASQVPSGQVSGGDKKSSSSIADLVAAGGGASVNLNGTGQDGGTKKEADATKGSKAATVQIENIPAVKAPEPERIETAKITGKPEGAKEGYGNADLKPAKDCKDMAIYGNQASISCGKGLASEFECEGAGGQKITAKQCLCRGDEVGTPFTMSTGNSYNVECKDKPDPDKEKQKAKEEKDAKKAQDKKDTADKREREQMQQAFILLGVGVGGMWLYDRQLKRSIENMPKPVTPQYIYTTNPVYYQSSVPGSP